MSSGNSYLSTCPRTGLLRLLRSRVWRDTFLSPAKVYTNISREKLFKKFPIWEPLYKRRPEGGYPLTTGLQMGRSETSDRSDTCPSLAAKPCCGRRIGATLTKSRKRTSYFRQKKYPNRHRYLHVLKLHSHPTGVSEPHVRIQIFLPMQCVARMLQGSADLIT